VAKGALIGYCHCDAHKGYVTSALYRSHECRKKQCPFLERFETNQYWQTIEGQERKKALKKEQMREQRQEEAKKQAVLDIFLQNVKREAQEMADYWFNPILITCVNQIEERKFIVFFVSDSGCNDWYEYRDIAFTLGKKYHYHFMIKHMKRPDGGYATVEDWKNRGK
jgi:hypothetical protein